MRKSTPEPTCEPLLVIVFMPRDVLARLAHNWQIYCAHILLSATLHVHGTHRNAPTFTSLHTCVCTLRECTHPRPPK